MEMIHSMDIVDLYNISSVVLSKYDLVNKPDDSIISDELKIKIVDLLNHYDRKIPHLGLELSHLYLNNHIIRHLYSPKEFTLGTLVNRLEILQGRLNDELRNIMFGYIPKEKVQYYFQSYSSANMSSVPVCFPSAVEDIKWAGICFAHNDYNATIFHCMRVVEVGAKCLVKSMRAQKHLDRPIELCDWGKLIAALEKEKKQLEIGSSKSGGKKDTLAFYSHAITIFANFKDAWRNSIAHSRKNFLEGETKDTLDNVRQFMQHLAQRIKE